MGCGKGKDCGGAAKKVQDRTSSAKAKPAVKPPAPQRMPKSTLTRRGPNFR